MQTYTGQVIKNYNKKKNYTFNGTSWKIKIR